jgi:hypothetical protein
MPSPDFPTTAAAFDTSFNGGFRDAFFSKITAAIPLPPPCGTGLAFRT